MNEPRTITFWDDVLVKEASPLDPFKDFPRSRVSCYVPQSGVGQAIRGYNLNRRCLRAGETGVPGKHPRLSVWIRIRQGNAKDRVTWSFTQ